MGENSAISWTDHTFNPWWGCVKVSTGCEHCYAEYLAVHRQHKPIWGPAKTTRRRMMSEAYWKQPLKWNRKAEAEGVRRRVFCASMADVFEDHPDVVDARARLWALIEVTPALDWLLLTKRPENIDKMLPERWNPPFCLYNGILLKQDMPSNVWLGISAENQDEFDTRWPVLEHIGRTWYPENIFLSLEPLLGPINIEIAYEWTEHEEDRTIWCRGVDWVIVGGESGPSARPMDLQWARDIRKQCQEAEIPFFFKQAGGRFGGSHLLDGVKYEQRPGQPIITPPPVKVEMQQMRMEL